MLDAADVTADAARKAAWSLRPFSTPQSWFGTKRIGDCEATLRIDVDLLEGPSHTYDDKTAIAKVPVLVLVLTRD